jgi:urease accessory protein
LPSTRSQLTFEDRNGQTILAASRVALPLLVQRPLHGPHGQAVVVALTPSGALFDGDSVDLRVSCGPRTDVTLTTASATKLNRCQRGEVRFELQVSVAAGATFRYLPYELIPFRGARYRQRIRMDLYQDARAWLVEVVGSGQTGAGFTYSCLSFETTLLRDERVTARERFVLTPQTAAQLRGYSHYGSLVALGPEWDRASATAVNARLSAHPPAGASLLPGGGLVARALADSAEPLRATLLGAVDCPAWLGRLLPP